MITPSFEAFVAFTIAGLTLLLVPGPAVMYITALGIREGRQTAVGAAFGLGVGNFVHAIAATVGLSAILASSAFAFSAVKYVGAAYLVFLGIQTLRRRDQHLAAVKVPRTTARREFRRGIVVNTLNPKVAIFFLAFVPQFVDAGRGSVAAQLFLLGLWFSVLGVFTDAIYGIAAGELGGWIRSRESFQRPIQTISGCTYIFLGLLAAVSSTGRTSLASTVRAK
ncbi:MAG: LysE family translocator [Thermomicrobiales bacterium]